MEVAVGGGDQGLRCEKISAGGEWKCNLLAMRGEVLCEKHYLSVHRRMRGEGDGGWNSGVGGGRNSGVDYGGRKRKRDDEGMGVLPVDGSEIKVVFEGNGVGGLRKRGRPKGLKNGEGKKVVKGNAGGTGSGKRGRPKISDREKIGLRVEVEKKVERRGRPKGLKNMKGVVVGNEVENKVLEGNHGGIGSGKRGRPKGLKNRKKVVVGNEVENKVLEGSYGGIGSGKMGRPKGLKNRKKVVVESEVEAMQVDPQGGGGILSMNSREVSDTVDVSVSKGGNFQGFHGSVLNENITINMGDGIAQNFNSLGSGGLMLVKGGDDGQPEVQKNANEVSTVNDASYGNAGTDDAPVLWRFGRLKGSKNKKKSVNQTKNILAALKQNIRGRGRPKGSKNKKKTILGGKSDGTDGDVSCINSGFVPAPVQKVERRGRPKGSKNKKKKIDLTEKRGGIECDRNKGGRGRPKGYETRKKILSVIKRAHRMRGHSANGGVKGGRGQIKGGYSWLKKSKDAKSIKIMSVSFFIQVFWHI